MPLQLRASPVVVEAPPKAIEAAPVLSPRLFFLHIMKTAGTTLCSFLEQQYATNRFPPFKAGALLKAAAKDGGVRKKDVDATAVFDRYDYLCAHTNFLAVLPPDFRFITMLREPEARLRSLFRHWQQFTDDEIERSPASEEVSELKRQSRSMTLEEFLSLDKRSIFRNFDNGMTRTLVENFPIARENSLSDEELVAEAKRTIDRAWCVGITERFDEFLDLLCWQAGWPPVPAVADLNVRSEAKQSREASRSVPPPIERAIRLDRQVYDHASRVFDDRFNAMAKRLSNSNEPWTLSAEHAAELHSAIDEHARHSLVDCARACGTASRPAVSIEMTDAIRGGGWLDREPLPDGASIDGPVPELTALWIAS